MTAISASSVMGGGTRRASRRTLWLIFALGLLANVLVCLPFVLDPLELRGATAATGTAERTFVVFLAGGAAADAARAFAATHPGASVTHQGGKLGTLLVRLEGATPRRAVAFKESLAAQPFAAFVMSGGAIICQ